MIRRNDYRNRNRPVFWAQCLLNCCFVSIITLFLLLEGGKASCAIPLLEGSSPYLLVDHAEDEAADDKKPVQQEREAPDENESENESETESENDGKDQASHLSHAFATALTFNFHSGKLLFFQLILSVESRAGISLIILHHCWKSFPH
jgi:hypothetical protein